MNKICLFLLIVFCSPAVFSQEVTNLRVAQDGNNVIITYDLTGVASEYTVNLFYTNDDGLTWKGPLKQVTGDVGTVKGTGINKTITWNTFLEIGLFEGNLQFKVVAEETGKIGSKTTKKLTEAKIPRIYTQEDLIKFKKRKTGWLVSAIATTGIGTFSYLQGNKLFDDYLPAGNDAADIRKKVEMYDVITPIALGAAGICLTEVIIQSSNQSKARKSLEIKPVALKGGGGFGLTFNF